MKRPVSQISPTRPPVRIIKVLREGSDTRLATDLAIRPMKPKRLIEYPRKPPIANEALLPVNVQEAPNNIDDEVSSGSVIKTWVKENLITEILQAKQGGVMETTKMWYASKTLWVNVLTLAWTFLGPLVGMPVLTPELTVLALGVINLILRIITKKEVVLS